MRFSCPLRFLAFVLYCVGERRKKLDTRHGHWKGTAKVAEEEGVER